ncbi:MAG: PilT/PilU family type 4a pilus ATPase [Puniceicoccales bacterium]|jgi:twitching motility protein PilT|nr:PilT/PilU family type 4a pilus ATPase [Puniceicoccales bacterium]
MSLTINNLIQFALNQQASDIHLRVDEPPTLRVDGLMCPLDLPNLTSEEMENFAKILVPEKMTAAFKVSREVDFAISPEIENRKVRLRVNVFTSCEKYGVVMRIINDDALSLDHLGLPTHSLEKIKDLLNSPRGLLLVTGPTGSGKSTTLAAMIDWINARYAKHIITIEDPIEYLYQPDQCIITQRELGRDTPSFQKAITGALRQDPDVILVGEMRDLATIEAAVSAAETGHLVLSTLHTTGSTRTVDRIIDAFAEGSKELVRTQLASNLIGVISQVLCRKKSSKGRVSAFEVMTRADSISNLIRENKTFRIQTEIEVNQGLGMLPLDRHLFDLYTKGMISEEEALAKAQFAKELMERIRGDKTALKKKGLFSF